MRFYRISYIILLALTAVMIGLTVADSVIGNGTSGIFSSVWIVFILTAFAVLQIVCLFMMKPAFSLRKAGFYLLHIGLVLFLCGSFVFYLFGQSIPAYIPVDETMTYTNIQRENSDTLVELGFGLGIKNFKVEKYEDTGTDKYYEAILIIEDQTSLLQTEKKLTVNRPVRENGWKIYLMNYTASSDGSYDVYLLLKKDPAEYISDAGICMIVLGTFIMCFGRRKEGKK